MSFEKYGYLNNELKKIKISADGEKAVRAEVDGVESVYEDVRGFRSVFSFVEGEDIEYLLDMERYVNKLQAEMDRRKDREERFMGKEYDDNVIG